MRLWSTEQLSEFLGVPCTWIYDRTRENGPEQIPHLKLGKYVRFDPNSEAFRRWLSAHGVGSDTQQDLQTLETKTRK